jgi:hypothetical protein
MFKRMAQILAWLLVVLALFIMDTQADKAIVFALAALYLQKEATDVITP